MNTLKPDTDALAALDNELDNTRPCECHCAGTWDRHGDTDCTRPATWYLEIHDYGTCQHPGRAGDPNMTPEGFRSLYFCESCLLKLSAATTELLRRLPTPAVCPNIAPSYGCGRPIAALEDLIPVKRPI